MERRRVESLMCLGFIQENGLFNMHGINLPGILMTGPMTVGLGIPRGINGVFEAGLPVHAEGFKRPQRIPCS